MKSRFLSLLLIFEIILQPIFAPPLQASDPTLKGEGDFVYYQIARPSDARKLPLPKNGLYASDLDYTLMQCDPFGNGKYLNPVFDVDEEYTRWIQSDPSRWFGLTARWLKFSESTLSQLDRMHIEFKGLDTLLGKNIELSIDFTRRCHRNIFYARESSTTKYKGRALQSVLLYFREAGKDAPPMVVIDDNLEELRQIHEDNRGEDLTLIHVDHKAKVRGYPSHNPLFPETIFDLEYEQTFYGGTGGTYLMSDKKGKTWVFKPMRQGHELFGELAYRALGEHNPDIAIYWHMPYTLCKKISVSDGPFRLAEYIAPLPDQAEHEIIRQSGLRLVVDAFFNNYDLVTQDTKGNFFNQHLDHQNLLRPLDLGACGICDHEGHQKEDAPPFQATISLFQNYIAYKSVTAQEISEQIKSLSIKLPRIFEAFTLAKSYGMLFDRDLAQFLIDRDKMVQQVIHCNPPMELWSGLYATTNVYSGAGVYLLCGNDVLLGIRRKSHEISNLGGFCEAAHRYSFVTAALEVQEESAGAITLDPMALLQCPRMNFYYNKKPFTNARAHDLFRYTIFFHHLNDIDPAHVKTQLSKATRDEETELEDVFRVPLRDLLDAAASQRHELVIEGQTRKFFPPFAMSLRYLAIFPELFRGLFESPEPQSLEVSLLNHNNVELRPVTVGPKKELDPYTKEGMYLTVLFQRPQSPKAELPLGKPLQHTPSLLALNKLSPCEREHWETELGKTLMRMKVLEKPDPAFEAFVLNLMKEEQERPDLHIFSHGTSGMVGFQWLVMTAFNKALGLDQLRLRAREDLIQDIPSAYEFVSKMVNQGAIEGHYTPGHQDSWMAVALSLTHCLDMQTSSPLRFLYKGTSRSNNGSNFTFLADMLDQLGLKAKTTESLLAGYKRLYRKFFTNEEGEPGCLLQIQVGHDLLDKALYLAGDSGLAVTFKDGTPPRASDYIQKCRSHESVPPVQTHYLGAPVIYDYHRLRGQLLLTPDVLRNTRYKFHFWPPMDLAALDNDLTNLIRTHLYMVMPQLITLPGFYKELPPAAEDLRQQLNLPRATVNLSHLAREAASALYNDDMGTVLEILTQHRSIRNVRFYVSSLRQAVTLEEFAKLCTPNPKTTLMEGRLHTYIDYVYNMSLKERTEMGHRMDRQLSHLRPFQRVFLGRFLKISNYTTDQLPFYEDELTYMFSKAIRPYHTDTELNRIYAQYECILLLKKMSLKTYLSEAVDLYEKTNTRIDPSIVKAIPVIESLDLMGLNSPWLAQLISIAQLGVKSKDPWHAQKLLKFMTIRTESLGQFLERVRAMMFADVSFKPTPTILKVARQISLQPEDDEMALNHTRELSILLRAEFAKIFETEIHSSDIHFGNLLRKIPRGDDVVDQPDVLSCKGLINPSVINPRQLTLILDIVRLIDTSAPMDSDSLKEVIRSLLEMHIWKHSTCKAEDVLGMAKDLADLCPNKKLLIKRLEQIISLARYTPIPLGQQKEFWIQALTHLDNNAMSGVAFKSILFGLVEIKNLAHIDIDLAHKAHPLTHLCCQIFAHTSGIRRYGPIKPELLLPFIFSSITFDNAYEKIRMLVIILMMIRQQLDLTDNQIKAIGDIQWQPLGPTLDLDKYLKGDDSSENAMKFFSTLEDFVWCIHNLFPTSELELNRLVMARIETGQYNASQLRKIYFLFRNISFFHKYEALMLKHLFDIYPLTASDEALTRFHRALVVLGLTGPFFNNKIGSEVKLYEKFAGSLLRKSWEVKFISLFMPVLGQINFEDDTALADLDFLLNFATQDVNHEHNINVLLNTWPTSDR